MKDVSKEMNFDVYTDLKNKNEMYNIVINLESEVDSHTREMVIALAGTVVRNNHKNLYGKLLEGKELSLLIKEKLNTWIPTDTKFHANEVLAAPLKVTHIR